MAFPYHFPSNTPAQTSRRRQLLDAYGQFAQLSAIIIPLFLFLLYHSLRFLSQNLRLRRGNGYAALQPSGSHHPRKKLRQSPRVATFSDQEAAENAAAEEKRRKLKGKGLSASIAQWWARFRWALGEPVGAGWGTWREWTIGAAWTAWLLFLTVNNTGDGAFVDILKLKSSGLQFFIFIRTCLFFNIIASFPSSNNYQLAFTQLLYIRCLLY